MKSEKSLSLLPKHPEIFLLTQNQSPGPLWERRCGDTCWGAEKGGRNQGPQNPHPFYKTASKMNHLESAHMSSNLSCFHVLRVGIFTVKQQNLPLNLPPKASEVKGRTERSAAQADLWNLLFPTLSHQGSGRWWGWLTLWEGASRRPNGVGSRRDREELSR